MAWSIPLELLASHAEDKIEAVVRKATTSIFQEVIEQSPINTGRFISNWRVARGSPDTTTTESTSQSDGTEQVKKALDFASGDVVYLTNSLPYAISMEYGYSYKSNSEMAAQGTPRQAANARPAPAGMVRLTLSEWAHHVDMAVAAVKG